MILILQPFLWKEDYVGTMNNILFRADSSSNIGLGHIMRDLVLAQQFPEAEITFATQNLKGNINSKILEAKHKLNILQSNDKEELVEVIKKLKIDLLIIDHYDITYEVEKYIKKNTYVKIFVLDDTYEKHHCDILLNHNLGANKKKYINLVPKYCELKCGSKYTLLRDEFHKEKKKKKESSRKKTIFVAMGGSDTKNISYKILQVLTNFKNIQINLITTSSNIHLKKLKKYVKKIKNTTLHIDSSQIAKLMRQSDLAIISPSVIVNEVHFMELPYIAIKTAKNQNYLYKYLKQNRFVTLKKFHTKKLKKHLISLGV